MMGLGPAVEHAEQFSYRLFFKSLGFSLVGIALFLVPVEIDGNQTILIGAITKLLRENLSNVLLEAVVAVTTISTLGGAYFLLFKPDWSQTRPALHAICNTNLQWFLLRFVGGIVGLMVFFGWGPEIISGESTGHAVFVEIGIPVLVVMSVASFLMPFLTDFGLMEFAGSMLRKPFEILFRVPGRSAVDAIASFVGSSILGILITINQYETGMYSRREAVAVATNFSVVSLPFSLVIANVSGLDHVFFPWYATVVLACLICAMIIVRIPPVSVLPDSFYGPTGKQVLKNVSGNDHSVFKWSVLQAMERARNVPSARTLFLKAWHSALDVVFGVLTPCLAIATVAAMLVFHTPVFDVLAYPIALLLDLIGLPEAKAAAPGFLIGFLDQFMPALVAGSIESATTRFVLAGLSLCQLIFMGQIGILLLRSSLSLNLWTLFVIFCLRTVITFPIFLMAAWFLFP